MNSNHPASTVLERAMGMAPLAKLAFTDIGGSGDALVLPTNYADIYRWGYNAGARISSSSWGQSSGGYSSYTAYCEQLDTVAWQHPDYLMVRSAGNSNNSSPADSVNSPATAKNIICCGANESGFGAGATAWQVPGTTDRNEIMDVAEFSSHGPSKEGLWLPTVLASGGWYIWSVDSDGSLTTNNSGITYMGGTSMSTPSLAGMCAQIRQYLTEGWWKTGVKTAGDAIANPSANLIKALVVLSTRNSPGAFSTDGQGSANTGIKNVPSMGQGWGAVVMDDALYFSGDARKLRFDDTRSFTASGQSYSYKVRTGTSTDTMNTFKVVLSYSDYPSALTPMDISVNNLNLTVQDSATGTTYLGNVFGTNGKSATGGVADTVNNLEVVWLLPSAAKGSRTMIVTVTAATIVRSPQPFIVTVGGDIISSTNFKSDMLAVHLSAMAATAGANGVNISWRTESEMNSLRWEIERSADPEQGFVQVGRMDARGTTSEPQDYVFTDPARLDNGTYYYRLAEIDLGGARTYHGPVSVTVGENIPAEYALMPAFPNPATGSATIHYSLKRSGPASLSIYNIAGQAVKTLAQGYQQAGHYSVSWDGRDDRGVKVANGIYLYRLSTPEFQRASKIVILR
jgi:hypothetical protein